MATLTVWEFPTALGAERAESVLEQLQKQELIKVHDAAFVMTSDAVLDKVEAAFEGMDMKLVTTNLSNEQEQALRHAFGED